MWPAAENLYSMHPEVSVEGIMLRPLFAVLFSAGLLTNAPTLLAPSLAVAQETPSPPLQSPVPPPTRRCQEPPVVS